MDVIISVLGLVVLFGCLAGPVLLVRAWWRRQTAPPLARPTMPPTPIAGPRPSTSATALRPPVPSSDADQRETEALVDGLIIGHLWTRTEYRDRLAEQEAATAQVHRAVGRRQELAEPGGTDDVDLRATAPWEEDEELDELDQLEEDDLVDAGEPGLWDDDELDDEY